MIRVICIQTYHAHWAGHSGYHHFLKYLPEDIQVNHTRIRRGRISFSELKGKEKFWFPFVAQWAKHKVNPWTTENDLLAEFRLLHQVREGLRQGGKVIVHFLDGEIGYNFFGSLCQFLGQDRGRVRLIASYHQPHTILEEILPNLERIKKLDKVITVGTSQLNFFDFLPEKQLRFVPHGIDTDYFQPLKRSDEGKNKLYCLTVGHWLRDFDAIEQVVHSAPEGLIFRIVAGQEHVKRFQPLQNVELYSDVGDDELLRLYQSSDIGLMPLQDSTANNGLLEMMGCGLPIITTRVGSVADYLPEGTGILIDGNELSTFLSAVKRLSDSPIERNSLGEAARRRALDLDWTNIAREMSEIYRKI